jgi:hypothetical protein
MRGLRHSASSCLSALMCLDCGLASQAQKTVTTAAISANHKKYVKKGGKLLVSCLPPKELPQKFQALNIYYISN